MSTACDLLREARKQHHLTLEDVADATLINLDFLHAIEQGRLDVLPQPYVRAFMREYAAVVGLDPSLLMEKLDRDQAAAAPAEGAQAEALPQKRTEAPAGPRAVSGAPGTAGTRVPEAARPGTEGPAAVERRAASPSKNPEAPSPDGASPQGAREQASLPGPEEGAPRDVSRYAAPAVVIVILAIGAVVLWNILGRKEPVASERPFHEVIQENERLANPESTALRPATPPESAAAASAGDSLTLVAQASDSVWVRMMRDDGLIRDYFFQPGESMTWHAREQFLFFTIGNPGAFSLKLNGQPVSLPGPAGRPIQHLVIRSTGVVTPGSANR